MLKISALKICFSFGLMISLLNVLISKNEIFMPLTEEEKKMWDFIVKDKRKIFSDVVEYMKPKVGIHKIIVNLLKTRWLIGFEYCEYWRKQIIITRQYTERRFYCKEHRILYHNEKGI